MATIKVTLTEDMLKLISNIRFSEVPDIEKEGYPMTWGLDFHNLYGGDLNFEDISRIIGRYNEHIEGTEEEALGADFPQDVKDYMWDMHCYILDNIGNIEELVHQFCIKGGLTAGTYKCKNYDHIWKRED